MSIENLEPQLQEVWLPLRTGLGRWGHAGGDAVGQHPGTDSSGTLGQTREHEGINSVPLGLGPDGHVTTSYKLPLPPCLPGAVGLQCSVLLGPGN